MDFVLGKDLIRTLFLNEPELTNNERLKTFLRKDPYYYGDKKRKRQEESGTVTANGKSSTKEMVTGKGTGRHKKKRDKPYWEDY